MSDSNGTGHFTNSAGKLSPYGAEYILPRTEKISKIIDEAKDLKTFVMPFNIDAKPGQFVMVWLPGVDSKPIGVSLQSENECGFTVSGVGNWSNKMMALKEGDVLGVYGPYGTNFDLQGDKVILIGGGYGAATLMLLAEQCIAEKKDVTMIIGSRSEEFLLYRERVKEMGLNTIFTTDDGSFGEKGYNTEVLKKLLSEGGVDHVYCCGPELMEKAVAEICRDAKVPVQISIERYMKCGFGVCGACCMDEEGKRVCVEGTVFSGEEALKMKEFGKYHRDASSTKFEF